MLRFSLRAACVLASLAGTGLVLGAQQTSHGGMAMPPAAPMAAPVESPEVCEICRMNRTQFAHSRMLVTFPDGSLGTCSLSCMSLGLRRQAERKVLELKVADYADGRTLIDARSAVWVTGGGQRGVMTALPKWAFARAADAQAFIGKQGGSIATFDQCLELASKERAQ